MRDHILRYRTWLDRRPFRGVKAAEGTEPQKLSPLTFAHILSDFRAMLQ